MMVTRSPIIGALRRKLRGGLSHAALLAKDTEGNIALLTALMLLPLVGLAGLGIDFWTKTNAQAEIDAAADAATLAAINRAATLIKSGIAPAAAITAGKLAGQQQFAANVGKVPLATTSGLNLDVMVNGTTISASGTWTATSKTSFGAVFGVQTLALNGASSSEQTLPSYVKLILLLDNSASMGIGSTAAEQQRLHQMTNCSVACHLDGYFSGPSSYQQAQNARIQTRIEVLKGAIKSITQRAEQVRETSDQFKIGLYTYSNVPQVVLDVDDPRSTDMNVVRQAAANITLTRNLGGTHFQRASTFIHDNVVSRTARGDGSSLSKPKIFVMVITDGVESYTYWDRTDPKDPEWMSDTFTPYSPTGPLLPRNGRMVTSFNLQSINPTFCAPMKALSNVTVMPLQVVYLVPTAGLQDNDPRFQWIANNLIDSGHTDRSFRNCASSPDLAFKGTTPTEITNAVLTMFSLTLPKSARLLN